MPSILIPKSRISSIFTSHPLSSIILPYYNYTSTCRHLLLNLRSESRRLWSNNEVQWKRILQKETIIIEDIDREIKDRINKKYSDIQNSVTNSIFRSLYETLKKCNFIETPEFIELAEQADSLTTLKVNVYSSSAFNEAEQINLSASLSLFKNLKKIEFCDYDSFKRNLSSLEIKELKLNNIEVCCELLNTEFNNEPKFNVKFSRAYIIDFKEKEQIKIMEINEIEGQDILVDFAYIFKEKLLVVEKIFKSKFSVIKTFNADSHSNEESYPSKIVEIIKLIKKSNILFRDVILAIPIENIKRMKICENSSFNLNTNALKKLKNVQFCRTCESVQSIINLLPLSCELETSNEECSLCQFNDVLDLSKNFSFILKSISKWILKNTKFNLNFRIEDKKEFDDILQLIREYRKINSINIDLNCTLIQCKDYTEQIIRFLDKLRKFDNVKSIKMTIKTLNSILKIKKYIYRQFSRNISIRY